MPALHVLAIGVAAKHAVDATRLPIDRHLRLRLESARHRWGRRRVAFWARYCAVWEVATEAALSMLPVGQAPELAKLATGVPKVWDVRRLGKTASADRAGHVDIDATPAHSALLVLPISVATEASILAIPTSWVPEMADASRRLPLAIGVSEVALATYLQTRF